jgi:hypothetical protein
MRILTAALLLLLLAAPGCSKRPQPPAGWPLAEVRLPPGAQLAAMPPLPVAPDQGGQKWSASFNWGGGWEQLLKRYDAELGRAGYEPHNPLAGFGQTSASKAAVLNTRLYTAAGKPYMVLLSNGKALGGSSDPEVGDYVLTIIQQSSAPPGVTPVPPPVTEP